MRTNSIAVSLKSILLYLCLSFSFKAMANLDNNFYLTGIIYNDDDSIAVLKNKTTRESHLLKVGNRLKGTNWRVKKITRKTLTVEKSAKLFTFSFTGYASQKYSNYSQETEYPTMTAAEYAESHNYDPRKHLEKINRLLPSIAELNSKVKNKDKKVIAKKLKEGESYRLQEDLNSY